MPDGERVDSAYVEIGISDAPAIAGMRRLRAEIDRQMAAIDRQKAAAKVDADITSFDRKIDTTKRKLMELRKARAEATVTADVSAFNRKIAETEAKLKALSAQRATIRVDAKELRDANRAADIAARKASAMSKAWLDNERASKKLTVARESDTASIIKNGAEVDKLRARYNRLTNDAARLEQKTGRPGGLFHTEKERLELARLRSEIQLTAHRIQSFGGTVEDIVPDLEDNESWIRRWGDALVHTRVHLGFFSASVRQLTIGLVALGPVLTSLIGSATSVVGVLGTGLAGASVVGAAGIAGLVTSAIGAALIIKPIFTEIGEVMKLQSAYTKAVIKYGKGSEQAGKAQEKLATGLKEIAPGARHALMELGKLKESFRERTGGPARKAIFGGFAESVKTAKALMPSFAKESVRGIETVSGAWNKWMRALRSGEGKRGIETIMKNLNKSLPPLLNGFGSLGAALGRITVSASKFLPSLNRGFASWAQGIENSVGSGNELDRKVERLIQHMRDWGHLAQATGRLLITLFNTSADSGDGLLKTLTKTFNTWTAWMQTVEGQESLKNFFAEAATETKQLFSALGQLAQLLWAAGRATAPISAGLFTALNVLGNFVQAAAAFGPMRDLLKSVGVILAGIWAVGKVQAFAGAVSGAAAALRGLAGAQVAVNVAQAAAGAGGAAGLARRSGEAGAGGAAIGEGAAMGATAGAGIWGGAKMLSKRLLASKFATGGAIAAGYFAAEFGAKLTEKLTGSDFLEGQSVWSSLLHGFNTSDVAKIEAEGIIKGELKLLGERAAEALRSGFITRLPDINKTFARAAIDARKAFGEDTPGWRKVMARNIEAAIDAIKAGMHQGAIVTKVGKERIQNLMRNLKLITGGGGQGHGQDPFGIADGFVSGWAKAGKASDQGINHVLDEMRKMPPRSRALAQSQMLMMVREFEKGGKLAKGTFSRLRSALRTEQELMRGQGIGSAARFRKEFVGQFGAMSFGAIRAINSLMSIVSGALAALKLPKVHFNIGSLPELKPMKKQKGGFTVPGYGSGDSVYRELPPGSFVLNREATTAYGLRNGGVPTLLEPKERVFMPHEVSRIGPERLAAMNAAVPRQKGGSIGPEPRIMGGSALADIGQAAIAKVYQGAKHYLDTHQPTGGATGPAHGPKGTSMFKGILMATWVRQALEYAAKHGVSPQPTSGYRSHAYNVSQGRTYSSEHEKTQYPGGAVDFGGFVDPAAAVARDAVVHATRSFKYPLLHPIGFRDDGHASGTGHMRGGLVFSSGGPVPPKTGELVGASYYGGPTDHVSGTVGAAGVSLPGTSSFAELAMGHALGGLPFHTKLKISRGGKSVIAEKLDIGLGGGSVGGHNRAIDLWYETANALDMGGLGVVKVSSLSGSAASAGGAQAAEQVPKQVKVKYQTYNVHGSELIGTQHEENVPLDLPGIVGDIPKTEDAIRKRLTYAEHQLLPKYRAAYAQVKQPATKKKLKEDLKEIEKWIRELRKALRAARAEKAKKRIKRKLARQLARITGQGPIIEAAEREYEARSEYASQVVDQEPEQTGEVASDWLTSTFEPYVQQQEAPAYAAVLGAESMWRNVTLSAEGIATQLNKQWELEIGYPQKGRKPPLDNPGLHYPPQLGKQPTAMAARIYELYDAIKLIEDNKNSTKAERARLPGLRAQLQITKAKRAETTSVLGEGRGAFNWFSGAGEFEDTLTQVQGIHWPDQHEKLGELPSVPVAGRFGGAIWETQQAIEELGLKIKQAQASGGPSLAEQTATYNQLREDLYRQFASNITGQGAAYVGAYASGGTIPMSGFALVGERGPELAYLPGGTHVTNNERTREVLESQGTVNNVTNYFAAPPPDAHTWARQQTFELEALS